MALSPTPQCMRNPGGSVGASAAGQRGLRWGAGLRRRGAVAYTLQLPMALTGTGSGPLGASEEAEDSGCSPPPQGGTWPAASMQGWPVSSPGAPCPWAEGPTCAARAAPWKAGMLCTHCVWSSVPLGTVSIGPCPGRAGCYHGHLVSLGTALSTGELTPAHPHVIWGGLASWNALQPTTDQAWEPLLGLWDAGAHHPSHRRVMPQWPAVSSPEGTQEFWERGPSEAPGQPWGAHPARLLEATCEAGGVVRLGASS